MLLVPSTADRRTERVLVDPMALDPTGLTTLDAWQPSIEGDLLAYQLSEGGTEESVLRVMDVATGEHVDGPIDRARYSPVAWLPGGEAFYYVRRLDPAGLPEDEQQYHRRVWLHRLGTDPADGRRDLRRRPGHPQLLRRLGVPRRPLADRLGRDRARRPRNDVWIADLDRRPTRAAPAAHAPIAVGLDARVGAARRPRRPALRRHRPRRPARPARRDVPARPRPGALARPAPPGRRGGARGLRRPRRPGTRRPAAAARRWTRHAVSEVTVHDLATGPGSRATAARSPLPGLGSVGGVCRPARGRPRGLVQLHRPHHAAARVPLDGRDGSLAPVRRPPGAVEVPDVVDPAGRVHLGGRHDGPDVRDHPGRRPRRRRRRRPARARRSSTATAASACR